MTGATTGGAFRIAHAAGHDWSHIGKALADDLERAAPRRDGGIGGLGFLYVTEELGDHMGSVLTYLRETTGTENWIGGVGFGIAATRAEYFNEPAAVAMIAPFAPEQFRVLGTIVHDQPGAMSETSRPFPGADGVPMAVVHGDATNAATPEVIGGFADESGAFLVGGLTALRPRAQIADHVTEGGVSGVLLSPGLGMVTGLTQGCAPIGPQHTITDGRANVLVEIDRRPALDVFLEDIGPDLAAHLEEAGHLVQAALHVPGSERADYLVRNLTGIDPDKGLLAIGDTIDTGQTLTFCTRNRDTAIADLRRMAEELGRRLNRPPRGGLYYSCVARGPNLFGPGSREMNTIHDALGDFPVAGFYANGEIFDQRLYGYTGVLVLFP